MTPTGGEAPNPAGHTHTKPMIPNKALTRLQSGIDLSSDDIRVGLLDNSTDYTEDPDTHDTVADLLSAANEYSDTNYGRVQLAGQDVSTDDANDRSIFDADNAVFPDLGSSNGDTVQAVFIYKHNGTNDSNNELLRVVNDADSADLPLATNGEPVTIEWDSADGIQTLSVN